MTYREIVVQRLLSHQIAETSFRQPEEILEHYGAMQAQDWTMAKWAMGLRLPDLRNSDIEAKFNAGEILRTHVLRPTWHFVLPRDIRWMLRLTSPRVHQANAMYHRKFDITPKLLTKAFAVIAKALAGKNYLTRDELTDRLKKDKVTGDRMRMTYIVMYAELEGLICSGPRRGKQFTYALLDDLVPAAKELSTEAALKKLAHRYFYSRGPATIQDYTWWSGLTVKDARAGIAMLDSDFHTEMIDGKEFIFRPMPLPDLRGKQTTFLMPDFDEYGISYRHRDMYHHPVWSKQNELQHEDYYHAIIVDGYFAGSWNRKGQKKDAKASVQVFDSLSAAQKNKVRKATARYHDFFAET